MLEFVSGGWGRILIVCLLRLIARLAFVDSSAFVEGRELLELAEEKKGIDFTV